MRKISEKTWNIGIALCYLISHVLSLSKLPVFADEAIYIHWAQVAFNEPSKYLFLSMLDGKPPLHIWLLMPFVKLFSDPLFGGRLLSVLFGLVSVFVIKEMVKTFGGNRFEQRISMIITTITPFLFFNQRMAIAESLILFLFSLSILFGVKLVQTKKTIYVVLFALSFGASLWTKTTALFFVPVFALIPLYTLVHEEKEKKHAKSLIHALKDAYMSKHTALLIIGGVLAGLLFYSLRISPLFPSLFSRSADYTFSLQDLRDGQWKYVLISSYPKVITWIVWYMTPFLCFVMFYGKKKNMWLVAMAFAYLIPLVLMGRVLNSRYFFPISSLLIIAAVFGFSQALKRAKRNVLVTLIGLYIVSSSVFIFSSLLSIPTLPLTHEDKHQYLMEWSAGFGIPEVRDYIYKEVEQGKIVTVGTEGFFGTLPDGLSIYFDKKEYAGKVYILGVGQPITSIPPVLIEAAKQHDTYLVVNRNRFLSQEEEKYTILFAFEKPYGGEPLLFIKVK